MKSSNKDKMAGNLDLRAYQHPVETRVIEAEDVVKIKSRALSEMEEKTYRQLEQLQKEAELLAEQANAIKKRIEISYKIYSAKIPFEPLIGGIYHLYEQEGEYKLMRVGLHPSGLSKTRALQFVNSVTLLSDYTWEIVY